MDPAVAAGDHHCPRMLPAFGKAAIPGTVVLVGRRAPAVEALDQVAGKRADVVVMRRQSFADFLFPMLHLRKIRGAKSWRRVAPRNQFFSMTGHRLASGVMKLGCECDGRDCHSQATRNRAPGCRGDCGDLPKPGCAGGRTDGHAGAGGTGADDGRDRRKGAGARNCATWRGSWGGLTRLWRRIWGCLSLASVWRATRRPVWNGPTARRSRRSGRGFCGWPNGRFRFEAGSGGPVGIGFVAARAWNRTAQGCAFRSQLPDAISVCAFSRALLGKFGLQLQSGQNAHRQLRRRIALPQFVAMLWKSLLNADDFRHS